MDATDKIKLCLHYPATYLDHPFGEQPVCIRIRAGNKTPIFVQIYTKHTEFKVTVRCNPGEAEFFRSLYPGKVKRGYYCPPSQQPYWNTVTLDGTVKDDELKMMFSHAYAEAVSRLPRYLQMELAKQI